MVSPVSSYPKFEPRPAYSSKDFESLFYMTEPHRNPNSAEDQRMDALKEFFRGNYNLDRIPAATPRRDKDVPLTPSAGEW